MVWSTMLFIYSNSEISSKIFSKNKPKTESPLHKHRNRKESPLKPITKFETLCLNELN